MNTIHYLHGVRCPVFEIQNQFFIMQSLEENLIWPVTLLEAKVALIELQCL